jgi:hypothetical protein
VRLTEIDKAWNALRPISAASTVEAVETRYDEQLAELLRVTVIVARGLPAT